MVSCSVAQPIILRTSTLKRKRPVQYVTGYKRKGKPYKKERVFCMYIGSFYIYNYYIVLIIIDQKEDNVL